MWAFCFCLVPQWSGDVKERTTPGFEPWRELCDGGVLSTVTPPGGGGGGGGVGGGVRVVCDLTTARF